SFHFFSVVQGNALRVVFDLGVIYIFFSVLGVDYRNMIVVKILHVLAADVEQRLVSGFFPFWRQVHSGNMLFTITYSDLFFVAG
ncbi:MAG: hypothetical protein ACOVOQ_00475, partial [Flavobacterium sp.]